MALMPIDINDIPYHASKGSKNFSGFIRKHINEFLESDYEAAAFDLPEERKESGRQANSALVGQVIKRGKFSGAIGYRIFDEYKVALFKKDKLR